jgi:hypothetical protein
MLNPWLKFASLINSFLRTANAIFQKTENPSNLVVLKKNTESSPKSMENEVLINECKKNRKNEIVTSQNEKRMQVDDQKSTNNNAENLNMIESSKKASIPIYDRK